MTRKDFELIAAVLAAQLPAALARKETANGPWRKTVEAMAAMCAGQNPRFDRARFLAACGMED